MPRFARFARFAPSGSLPPLRARCHRYYNDGPPECDVVNVRVKLCQKDRATNETSCFLNATWLSNE